MTPSQKIQYLAEVIPAKKLHERAKQLGYKGNYQALYQMCNRLKTKADLTVLKAAEQLKDEMLNHLNNY